MSVRLNCSLALLMAALSALAALPALAAPPIYHFTDLGTLGGTNSYGGYGINNNGLPPQTVKPDPR